MFHPHRESGFAPEFIEEIIVHDIRIGDLQRDLDPVNRVVGLVNGSAGAGGQAPFDAVFAELLACPQEFFCGHGITAFIRKFCRREWFL